MPLVHLPDGPEIAYRTEGSGPTDLILVHGWAGSGAYFDETIASLDLRRVRVTTVDLAGHGDSPDWDESWSLDAIDDTVLAAADATDARTFVALGFSMGGKFVQHLALHHPDRVSGLILVAGTQASAFALPPEVLDDWYARAGSTDAMEQLIRSFLTGPVDEVALGRFATHAARVPRGALEGTMRITLDEDFDAELASIAVPTLVVAGAQDGFFTVELLTATIVERIRGARLEAIDCGHEVGLERPRELAALVEAFLSGYMPIA